MSNAEAHSFLKAICVKPPCRKITIKSLQQLYIVGFASAPTGLLRVVSSGAQRLMRFYTLRFWWQGYSLTCDAWI